MPPTDCIMRIGMRQKIKKFLAFCSNANYHGHNYDLEVKVVGEVDPMTGMVIDLKLLKDLYQRKDRRSLRPQKPQSRCRRL